MRSKGSRFTLGVWGLRVCSLDVAFASATVRNRPQWSTWGQYGRACCEFCKSGHFWRFQTSRSLVSPGKRGVLWHSNMFLNVSKAVFCGRTSSGVNAQIPWQPYDENWRKPRTKHRFWGSKFWCSWENSLENIDSVATKWKNLRMSRTKCSFRGSNMSRLVASPCLWGKLQNLCFSKGFQTDSIALRGRRGFSWHFHVSANGVESRFVRLSLLQGFQRMTFIFRGMCNTLDVSMFILHGRRSTLDVSCCVFSRIALSGLHQAATACKSHGRHRTSWACHFTWQGQHFRHSTLDTPHSTHYTRHSTLYTSHSTLYTLHSTLYTLDFRLYTLHSTLYTLHSTLYTLHFTLHTSHFTLYTPDSPLYTLHSTFYILHSTLYTLHFTL